MMNGCLNLLLTIESITEKILLQRAEKMGNRVFKDPLRTYPRVVAEGRAVFPPPINTNRSIT